MPELKLSISLRREQWISLACLALVTALAWTWLIRAAAPGAMASGASMPAMDMPGMAAPTAPATGYFVSDLIMWFLMMTAMMLPSAAPMILLYARFVRGTKAQGGALAPTGVFAAMYLAVWAGFSVAAAAVQTALIGTGLVGRASLALGDHHIAGGLLIAAGVYQLTPLKGACLAACRSPLSFLTRLWRPGWLGAMRLGLVHGLYCVGCCWLVMALLFIGGVMNLVWVARLSIFVLIEKVLPFGARIGQAFGGVAILAGAALLILPVR